MVALGTLGCLAAFGLKDGGAALRPSADLRFVLALDADTVTVGDPIPFRASGAGPIHGTLLLPEFADSIGPFSVLDLAPVQWSEEEGRRSFVQEGRLALFATGEFESPRVPLFWIADAPSGDGPGALDGPGTVAEGDTLVAYTAPRSIVVRSLLPETMDLSDPQAALTELREVKDVVVLERNWTWAWALGAALLAAALVFWFWKRRRRAFESFQSEPRPQPQLAPDAAFFEGLRSLQQRQLLERGEVKHYYAGLSLLLRGYLEGRFSIFAVEATREEILPQIMQAPRLADDDRRFLRDWLTESDLVKFAKMDRGATEASDLTVSVREWVEATTRAAREWAAEQARVPAQIPTVKQPQVPAQKTTAGPSGGEQGGQR